MSDTIRNMRPLEPRPLPGPPLAIDLLNTRWRPDGRTFDWLDEDAAVQDFAASYNVDIPEPDVVAARAALTEVRDLAQRLFESEAIEHQIIGEVDAFLANAAPTLMETVDGPRLVISSNDPTRQVAIEALVNAVELLGDRSDRIRSCEHDDCTLWFVDTSKAGRRRWCTMDRCGNRAKAQRHYNKSRKQQ